MGQIDSSLPSGRVEPLDGDTVTLQGYEVQRGCFKDGCLNDESFPSCAKTCKESMSYMSQLEKVAMRHNRGPSLSFKPFIAPFFSMSII